MSESLVKYGTSFQSKIISSLLTDIKFTKQIIDILEVSYFDTDSNKFLVKSIKEYFHKYKSKPTGLPEITLPPETVDEPIEKPMLLDNPFKEPTPIDFSKTIDSSFVTESLRTVNYAPIGYKSWNIMIAGNISHQ